MQDHLYTARFEYFNEDGQEGYSVTVPALPGCVTWGRTLDEAKAAAADAIQGYLEVLIEDGEPIPPDVSRTDLVILERIPVAV